MGWNGLCLRLDLFAVNRMDFLPLDFAVASLRDGALRYVRHFARFAGAVGAGGDAGQVASTLCTV